MSAPLDSAAVYFLQRILRAAGLYLAKIDGDYGPKTAAAEAAWDAAHDAIEKGEASRWGGRTRELLRTVLPVAHLRFREGLHAFSAAGFRPRVISGTRTYSEQDALFRIGRRGVKGEKRVTDARAGQSRHNHGIAVDFGLFAPDGSYYATDRKDRNDDNYGQLGKLWKPPGVEWGGDWPGTLVDTPHYQLRTGLSTAGLRRRFEAGEPILK